MWGQMISSFVIYYVGVFKEIKKRYNSIYNSLSWIIIKFFACGETAQVFLNSVDIEEVCMRYMSLPLITSLMARSWIETRCGRAYI